MNLDNTDLRLLAALQADASPNNQMLAETLGLSAATTLRRVRRLREQGLIESQVALLSPERLGPLLQAIVEVSLDRQEAEALAAFEARACADEAVGQCYRVSPGPDFVLIVTVRDMPAYQAFAQRLFTRDANVRNVKAFFSLHLAKFATALPLPLPQKGGAAQDDDRT